MLWKVYLWHNMFISLESMRWEICLFLIKNKNAIWKATKWHKLRKFSILFWKLSTPDLLRCLTLSQYTIIGSSSGTYGVTPVLIDGWNHSFWYGSNKWHACLFIVISWCESISQVRWLVLIVILEKRQVYFLIILSACWISFYPTMLFFLRV